MNTADEFKKSGYIVLKNLVDTDKVAALYDYTLERAALGNMDDGQVPGSASFYEDKEVVHLRDTLLPKIEAAIQLKLLPVFCYNRIYRTGAVLRMHKDSERAEISASVNLGQQGDLWDLWLVDYQENAQRITLSPGDALIYYGSRLHHWRGKLEHADLVSQVMFHCVEKEGKHARAAKWEVVRKIRKRIREMCGIAY